MSKSLVSFALRGFQVIFAAVVLGLSVSLIRDQGYKFGTDERYSSPIILRFAAFVGGLTLLTAFVSIAAEFVSALQGKILFVIDAIITLINVAGGIVSPAFPRALSPDKQGVTSYIYICMKTGGYAC